MYLRPLRCTQNLQPTDTVADGIGHQLCPSVAPGACHNSFAKDLGSGVPNPAAVADGSDPELKLTVCCRYTGEIPQSTQHIGTRLA